MGDSYISTGALFLACFHESVNGTRAILASVDLTYDAVSAALDGLRGHNKVTQKDGESKQSILDEYTTDVTAQARRGELDPVIGRDLEIQQTIEILSRRKKIIPCLLANLE